MPRAQNLLESMSNVGSRQLEEQAWDPGLPHLDKPVDTRVYQTLHLGPALWLRLMPFGIPGGRVPRQRKYSYRT